ncbi:5-dehydro-4-deoxy-D-glucuronate isomerase [Halomonas sp. SpR8]|uniref:5-dehydro-4-deoxy-D-glucuronate isomerase n=1 Tax=Halomonas sp. SpR8 TaxID=3050463 RepID=UPI0027E521B1|nr:5-dehydro-4-deoxy-D-glucuronate isomerase [Halomonas sp. SpR8]MDQ7727721.1 5-dehydro-4-deoxy-D-glucuronate isomerase [Halomonas sp. SpR8]
MKIRHESNPEDVKNYTTESLRNHFLIESLFKSDELNMVYSHYDRLIVGGTIPLKKTIKLDAGDTLRTDFFLERREIGIVNIGSTGKITVDGKAYSLNKRDCLYIGLGNKEIIFHSNDSSDPAIFYFVSSNAHKEYPTKVLTIKDAVPTKLGSDAESNNRTIYKYIHGEGIQSCQLMMGMTLLEPNNMWNTMPPHVHDRRSEIYLYFDMDEETRAFHFMGKPEETRHLLVKNQQAIISPPWSIHSGVGTKNYTFIWAMAGENYTFKDMDFIPIEDLR